MEDFVVHHAMRPTALHKHQSLLHNGEKLHGVTHICQTVSDALAVRIVVVVDSKVDEVRDRLTPAFVALLVHLLNAIGSPTHRGGIDLEQCERVLDVLICQRAGDVKFLQVVFEFAHYISFLPGSFTGRS